ncbi:urease accessory protein UreD [Rhodococcoides yunnanense]|uniref:urease accessory protein UreD n=1 Tax=Rhodococcoides yunnanense TaxID=278209 RepID=UPI0009343771|nr:urease accessory protein UreD [Rhodococcus yunnanensis]
MTDTRALDLSFTTLGGRTVFDRRRYRWPQTVGRLFHLDTSDPGWGRVIVQNAGASLHPRDHVRQRVVVRDGGRVDVVGQGAMQVNGVPGAEPAVERTELEADASSTLVYRPEPRILRAFARVEQHTHVELRGDAAVVLTDAVVVHPDVTTESFGSFRSRVTVASGGHPGVFDVQYASSMPCPGSGLRAFATVYLLCTDVVDEAGALDALVHRFDGRSGAYAASSVLPNGMGHAVRVAATGGDVLRDCVASVVGEVRCFARGARAA